MENKTCPKKKCEHYGSASCGLCNPHIQGAAGGAGKKPTRLELILELRSYVHPKEYHQVIHFPTELLQAILYFYQTVDKGQIAIV